MINPNGQIPQGYYPQQPMYTQQPAYTQQPQAYGYDQYRTQQMVQQPMYGQPQPYYQQPSPLLQNLPMKIGMAGVGAGIGWFVGGPMGALIGGAIGLVASFFFGGAQQPAAPNYQVAPPYYNYQQPRF